MTPSLAYTVNYPAEVAFTRWQRLGPRTGLATRALVWADSSALSCSGRVGELESEGGRQKGELAHSFTRWGSTLGPTLGTGSSENKIVNGNELYSN